ncbi:squalene/phytoene synthase family protein [Yoonia sp.]|uniref:squalene/phytoene synthase family protein n=1 Tax=Yoonia sp. TaxID=2212373 RepID=UPI003F6D1420
MSLHACAALVERADPDRFRATMAAPVAARRVLFPLYAFNVEVSRAPWVTQEPMIAEMRLQWWRDALEEIGGGGKVRKHEVVDALASVLDTQAAVLLDGLIAARRWDVYKDTFEDAAHFDSYIDATSGHLMWTAARLLGPADEAPVRDFAYGVGVANFLRAVPGLEDSGRIPLVDGSHAGVKTLAADALDRLNAARQGKAGVSRDAGHALLCGHAARPVLSNAVKDPSAVALAALDPYPFGQSLRLLHVTLRGWWI